MTNDQLTIEIINLKQKFQRNNTLRFQDLHQVLDLIQSLGDTVQSGSGQDATSTNKGTIKLAGDLSGTADLPTVPGLLTKAEDSTVLHKSGNEEKNGNLILNNTLYLKELIANPGSINNIGVDENGAVILNTSNTSDAGAVVVNATNKTGFTIPKGTAVYINGAQGSKATIALALADPNITTSLALGLTESAIVNNASGNVVILGEISNLDTSLFANGDKVFLSPTIPGGITTVVPVSPNNVTFVGTVTSAHATQGKIVINILYTSKLDRLADVTLTSPADRQILMYESASNLWKDSSLNNADIITALGFNPENKLSKGIANGYASLDASGLIPLIQLPPSVIERLVIVADQAARFALTTATVQNGDTVKQLDTNIMYYVKDDTNLSNSNGYEDYKAGAAASAPWSGITGTPTTLAGYGIADGALNATVLHNSGNESFSGIKSSTSTGARIFDLTNNGISQAISVANNSTGSGYSSNNTSAGTAMTLNNGSNGVALKMSNYGGTTGLGIWIDNALTSTNKPFSYTKNAVEKAFLDDGGNFSAQTLSGNSLTLGATQLTESIMSNEAMAMSTGLYSFGGISIATSTLFNVGAVSGYIIDTTNIQKPVPIAISYAGGTNLSTPHLLTAPATYLSINSSGALVMSNIEPDEVFYRNNIILGVIGHPSGTLTGVGNRPDIIFDLADQFRDMFRPIRLINDGVFISPNSTNLTIKNTAGKLYGLGIGFVQNGKNNPTALSIAANVPITFQYRTQTGASTANLTSVIPGSYDSGGIVTAIGGGSGSSTNQRIYLLENGNFRLQYGQTVYSSLSSAISAAQTESFTVFSNNKILGILIGILAINKNATNLSDSSQAVFMPVSKFGETVGAAAGIAIGTLQTSYNNSVEPEILTNSTLGAFTVQRGSALDTDNTLEIKNGAGVITASITGEGKLSIGTSNSSAGGKLRVSSGTTGGFPTIGSIDSKTALFTSDSSVAYGLLFGTNGATGHSWIQSQRVDGTATSYPMFLQPIANNVIIGTTTDNGTDRLQVTGSAISTAWKTSGGTVTQTVMGDGSLKSVGAITKTRKDITGTTYTLLSSDVDKILYTTNVSPVVITIPSGLTINQEYEVFQFGSGQVSYIVSGTTLKYTSYEQPKHEEIYTRVFIAWIDTETYQLTGQLSAY